MQTQPALPLHGGQNLAETQLQLSLRNSTGSSPSDADTGQLAFPADVMGASTRVFEIDWLANAHPAVKRLGRLVEDVASKRQDEATVRNLLIAAIKRQPSFAGKLIDRLLNEALAESVEKAKAFCDVANQAITACEDDEVTFDDITDQEVMALQDWLLERSLHTLMDARCGEDVRIEVWQWVLAGMGETEHVFGYHQCCLAAGVDPEEMFDRLDLMTRNAPWRFRAMDPEANRVLAAQLL